MSAIRPLERDDLPAVAGLYERVARSGTNVPAAGLAEQFARTVLDHPWADPELPSLVYEDPRAGIVGFIGSHPRRLRLGERRLRLACSGQLVAHPDFRSRGVGALLLRKYLAGPQDISITDGATDTVRVMWEGLGGATNGLASLSWTRVFAPAAYAASLLARRRGRRPESGPLPGLADRLAARPFAPAPPEARSEPLTAGTLREAVESLAGSFELLPDYDEPFLEWLLREAAAVRPRGALSARLVRAPDGRVAGSYLAYLKPGGVSQAIQVAAAERDAGLLLDELFHSAAAAGSAAISGRLEPHLHAALRKRRCLVSRSEWALVSSSEERLLATVATGRALLTRLDGEWWMGHHLA
jgi:GNAT superfamily N-acetyltransferase